MANAYQCPLCGQTIERNLILFLNHTESHVIDQIKKEHPAWVTEDGACQPCAEYYRSQLQGESGEENIGPRGRQGRFVAGVALLALAFLAAFGLHSAGFSRAFGLFLLPLFFLGMLGLLQARQKTCAFLAVRGFKDMGAGEAKVQDPAIARRLRDRGRRIFIQSAVGALLLTALVFIFS